MATTKSVAETVKTAIITGKASDSTVTTLQSLLSSSPGISSQSITNVQSPTKSTGKARTTGKAAPRNVVSRKVKKDQDFNIHDENTQSLSPKARFALATEVVNVGLKALPQTSTGSSKESKTCVSAAERALQSCSGNAIPVRQRPTKPTNSAQDARCSLSEVAACSVQHQAVAECVRLAFSYLRSIDCHKLGVRPLPKFQLENGMLSLVGRMINAGLDNLAVKELRVIKRRLGQVCKVVNKQSRTTKTGAEERETLASLLRIDFDFTSDPEIIPLVVTYHLNVLRVICRSSKPAVAEEACQYLGSELRGSPVNAIMMLIKANGDIVKGSRQLENIVNLVLQLCPSVCASADQAAQDLDRSPRPVAAFRLQMHALKTRQEIWKLEHHHVNVDKDLAEPFSKCLGALMRRSSGRKHTVDLHEMGKGAYNDLGIRSARSSAIFSAIRTLFTLANEAGLIDESYAWAAQAIEQCAGLEACHARLLAACSMRLSSSLARIGTNGNGEGLGKELDSINKSLKEKWTGNQNDFEILLEELGRLVPAGGPKADEDLRARWRTFCFLSAGFASRYTKSFPGNDKGCKLASQIIRAAVTQSKTTEDIVSWATKESAYILIRSGAFEKVFEVSASRSLVQAWSSSTTAFTLNRILKALMVKVASSYTGTGVPRIIDESLVAESHLGTFLESQLHHILELAHKRRYQQCLQAISLDIATRLASIYSVDSHPIRRARVGALLLRGGEQFPEVFVSKAVQVFLESATIHPGCLGMDAGLSEYISDINASLALAEAFHNGHPPTTDLTGSLSIWQGLLAAPENINSLELVVDDPRVLIAQLVSLEGYFGVLCDDVLRAEVARVLWGASERCGVSTGEQASFAMMLVRSYTALGYVESAGEVLEEVRARLDDFDRGEVQALEYHLCRAEMLLHLDQHAEGQIALENARKAYCAFDQQRKSSSRNAQTSVLQGRGWLLQSQLLLALGRSEESLDTARRATKLLSGIWSRLERSSDHIDSTKVETDPKCFDAEAVDILTNKVSKLNLKPAKTLSSPSSSHSERKGAPFWPVARVLVEALLHLTDVYAHHGMFNEASYASEQAMKTAEAINARRLLCRVRCHRSVLLTAAGRMEDAELCLAQEQSDDATMPLAAKIELLQAQAALASKNGEFEDAHTSIEQAEAIARQLQSDQPSPPGPKTLSAASAAREANARPNTAKKSPRQGSTTKTARAKVCSNSGQRVAKPMVQTKPYVFRKLEARLQLEKATVSLRMGCENNDRSINLAVACAPYHGTFKWRQLEYETIMHQLGTALEADFAFNALPETTLSFPALQHSGRQLPKDSTIVAPSATSHARSAKTTKRKAGAPTPFESLLSAARQCMAVEGQATRSLSTTEVHKQSAMASNASLLLSATSMSQTSDVLHPAREAWTLELGRIHATQCQSAATSLEKMADPSSDLTSWPVIEISSQKEPVMAATFQDELIDVIPASWTAVSMSLNEDCSEIFVSRYRRGQSPLILRLPFSRQKSEDIEDDVFDFAIGKAELADIIELSNYSCHSSVETNVKGAKTNWWSEREALDLRLQELLINIENIWLGGFRGIFSQHKRNVDQLSRFRKAFDAVLGRHLPSRRAPKGGVKSFAMDDQVLELFIGLGTDQDGQLDLDEPLSDLLYFVVDMLQFNGERNAYDEIDFDSMSIEVLDALRSYHDSVDENRSDAAHLILVLDRRLHAFPWESLPCLQDSSVSRVDSMLTLRDRLLEMQSKEGRYTVSKKTGSYILNPGGDLKGTESTMGPELTKLAQGDSFEWTSIVRREPSEDEFKAALSASATLMYFGHGSGAQYIRPRAIRRLEQCSEVVWLMGCSSGAVQEHGELEPYAVPLAYLAAGRPREIPSIENIATRPSSNGKCMAVLATLWDVTDKDIDRFSLAVGEEWGLWRPPPEYTTLPVKTPKKRVIAAPVTPQKTAKTPKTPKVKQTPTAPKTPARSASRQPSSGLKGTRSLVEAVAKSRDACYLRYLNGAAPVVYGVPVWLGD